jgi:hypothetical protein
MSRLAQRPPCRLPEKRDGRRRVKATVLAHPEPAGLAPNGKGFRPRRLVGTLCADAFSRSTEPIWAVLRHFPPADLPLRPCDSKESLSISTISTPILKV